VWRIGIPVSALVLVLLAIPMSFVNPRAGRSANLLFALLTFMVYSNLLSVSQARVSQGRLDFSVGVWLVHAGMVLLLVVLFAQRMQLIRLRLGK
jgi:lipopolysaccharide export system permease protein